MSGNPSLSWIVAPPQCEHLPALLDDNGLVPTIGRRILGNNHVAGRDRITRHRLSLGLLYPNGAASDAKPNENSSAHKKTEKSSVAADRPGRTAEGAFPRTWEAIDIGRLVLAKEDGPWRSWWEAIPTEKSRDSLTLRWRDFPQVPNIVRPRFSLALLCPDPK